MFIIAHLPTLVGCLEIWLHDSNGRVCQHQIMHNLIVDTAKTYLGDLLRGATGSTILRAMAIGSGSETPVAEDIILRAEVARLTLPAAEVNTSTQKNLRTGTTVILRQTFGPNVSAVIREVGLFGNIASPPGAVNSGVLLNRAAIGPFTMGIENTLTIESRLLLS